MKEFDDEWDGDDTFVNDKQEDVSKPAGEPENVINVNASNNPSPIFTKSKKEYSKLQWSILENFKQNLKEWVQFNCS